MNNAIQQELSLAFIEVRKAYRLLYFYQRRVLDTVKYLTDALGMRVQSGWSLYSENAPRNGRNLNLDLWAWDWLNMYMYEFYCGAKIIGDDSYQFAIQIQSDTGPFDEMVEATNVTDFGPVDIASTRLLFIIGKNRWKNEDENAGDAYFYNISTLKAKESPIYVEKSDGDNKVFFLKSYLLESFCDEESILSNIRDFKTELLNNNLPDIFKV